MLKEQSILLRNVSSRWKQSRGGLSLSFIAVFRHPTAVPFVLYGSWEDSSLLCQVESEKSLESWAHALDEDVDLRPQQTEQERAKVDIELKAKEAWTSREEGIWGGL